MGQEVWEGCLTSRFWRGGLQTVLLMFSNNRVFSRVGSVASYERFHGEDQAVEILASVTGLDEVTLRERQAQAQRAMS